MPDHIHLIVEGLHGNSDFKRFMKLAKQLTGFHIKRMTGYPAWVDGYFERIVRHDDDLRRYVEYILQNPVKAGLAPAVGLHPHTWTASASMPDLQVGRPASEHDSTREPETASEYELLSLERSSPD